MPLVDAFDHIVLNVRDVDAAARWYGQVLGMAREDRAAPGGATRTAMHFGHNKINLRPITATQEDWFTGLSPCPGSDDLCFLTQQNPEAVIADLARHGVAVELGPVTRAGARGPIRSVYVRDPDGNLIEIASYP
ncbi:VOC family protein [Sphingomonas sp. R3G8C]|uniref:VOC family protein n=1 Tax=Novosphingobium rhizosphaerae TaxID=1551649 RepID=UPI0015CD2240